MFDDTWFERLAAATREPPTERTPATLKSKIFSVLVTRMAESGPLLDVKETKKAGGHLCIFEESLMLLPQSTGLQSRNPCRICHARVLGERLPRAPIFWPGCPYAEFHNT